MTRAIFVRGVAEYDDERRDALRDDSRTDLPIAVKNPDTGVYERTAAWRRQRLRTDWLFSTSPRRARSSSLATEARWPRTTRAAPRRLLRLNDGFFVKVSYLWRL